MKLTIHAHHLSVPKDLPQFLDKHVTRPLARVFDAPAAELAVHLGDARPAKGGVDQSVRLTFRMPGARAISVGSISDDLYKSLLDAGERLKRHVRKQVSKMRATSRKLTHRPLGRTWRERSTRGGVTPDGEAASL